MKFFTSVEYRKGQLFVRGYDEVGEQVKYKTLGDDIDLRLWIHDPSGHSDKIAFDGSPLRETRFNSFSEIEDFNKSFGKEHLDIHGVFPFENQYITQKGLYENPDFSKIRIAVCDIETTSSNGFPSTTDPQEMVQICSLWNSRTQRIRVFCLDVPDLAETEFGSDVDIIPCQTESELLHKVLDYFAQEQFDVISAWNGDLFDYPYLYYRAKAILSKKDAQKFSPWRVVGENTINVNNRTLPVVNFLGSTCLDYLSLYKKFMSVKQESYKLDHIAEVELGERKLDYSEYGTLQEFWEKDPISYFKYNIQDVRLVVALDKKLKLFELIFTLGYIARTNFSDIYSPVKTWESLCYNYLWDRGMVVPPSKVNTKQRSFAGAYVKEPIPGLYTDVVSFDVTSLYPSLIRMLNISPETRITHSTLELPNTDLLETLLDITLVKEHDPLKNLIKEVLPEQQLTMSINQQFYTKTVEGMIPNIMSSLFNRRVLAKKEKIKLEQELETLEEELASNAETMD